MSRTKRPIAVELCAGVGGMSLGFEEAGFKIAAAFELDEMHTEYHAKNFPRCMTVKANISELTGADVRRLGKLGDEQIDVLFGGSPCQGFSLIGRRDAEDPRSEVLFDFARLIGELQPSYFVVENVEGLLLGDAKSFYERFVAVVTTGGYSVCDPWLLTATDFGVPQRRKRVFIVGYKRQLTKPTMPVGRFNDSRNGSEENGSRSDPCPNVWDAIGDLSLVGQSPTLFKKDGFKRATPAPSQYAKILRGEERDPENKSQRRPTFPKILTGCLLTTHKDTTIARFRVTPPGTYEAITRFYRLSKDGYSNTLRAGTDNTRGSYMAARPIHPEEPRVIVVREAARLHSFPDWFIFHPTRWHAFRQIGNSVPPRLARSVAASVREALSDLS
ncbi:MAG TPA: DNA cytosine methyltransferase [Pyrinomonadaceae bacterium]|nr:DNA cytosine methyltransferase [Pyrinomonadaceae bacterium]